MTPRAVPIGIVHPQPLEPILPVPADPEFPDEVLGVWRFNESLEDDVGQFDFSPSTGSVSYISFDKFELIPNAIQNRSALLFESGKSYLSSPDFLFTTDFTVAFWYYSPQHVGFTRHAQSRELEPKLAPIVAKGNSSKTSTVTNLSNSSFIVTEVAYSKTQNAVRVFLPSDGVNVSHIITSEPYLPGLHHVLMTFIQSQGRFRVDIDGKTGILHAGPTASLSNSGGFRINDIVPGFLAHKTTQAGAYIFDLVFTRYGSRDNESLKAFRYGYEHISFGKLFDSRFSYFGMSYAQPATVSTTQIFVDGGNIFAARSNGEIVQGARPIWDKEFDYPHSDSLRNLTISQEDTVSEGQAPASGDRVSSWTPSGLKVQGVSVKI